MILKSLVLLITINTFVVPDQYEQLRCYYSRFMLYSFTMRGISFSKEPTLQKEEIRIQSKIVIAMIEELVEKIPSRGLQVFMKLNLYLNHVFEIPMLKSTPVVYGNKMDISLHLTSKSHDPRVVVKESFQTFHKDIIKMLTESVSPCKSKNPLVCDSSRECSKEYVKLNNLLPVTFNFTEENSNTDEFIKAMNLCNYRSKALSSMLKADSKRTENSIFNPKKMFFYEILETYKDGVTMRDAHLDLLRNVSVNGKLLDGRTVNITILYDMIKHSYEPQHIPPYQRQVLAATVHPVLDCIGSYLLLVKQIYYNDDDKFDNVNKRAGKHGNTMYSIGDSVVKSLNKFIALKLLPEKVQTHLTKTSKELKKFSNFVREKSTEITKSTWIETLYSRCSVPMQNNLLSFDDYDRAIMNISTKDKCEEIILKLNEKTDKLHNYISALEKHKNDISNVAKNKYFEYMFSDMFQCKLMFDIALEYKHAFGKILDFISANSGETSYKHLLDM